MYVCRTIPEIVVFLWPLDEAIHQHFIPAITGLALPWNGSYLPYRLDWVAWAYRIHLPTHNPSLSHPNRQLHPW